MFRNAVSGKEKKMMLRKDAVCYTDLVNNYKEFHNQYDESVLLDFQGKWGDDSDYSHFQTIENLLENLTSDDLEKSHIVSVDISDIFSSEESLGGCDRPLWSIEHSTARNQQLSTSRGTGLVWYVTTTPRRWLGASKVHW